jgi:putative FmdB family regulatory protein
MPIYAYRCSSCDYQNDVMQKINEAPLSTCPVCGKVTFSRQLTAASFQLKGKGYYATDFKNDPQPKTETPAEPVCAPCASAGSCPVASGDM